MSDSNLGSIAIILIILAIIVVDVMGGAFVDQKIAVETLEKQGFTDVKVIEKQWFFVGYRGCDQSDAVKFTVSAVNPRNQTVELYVCSGWLTKGATVRNR